MNDFSRRFAPVRHAVALLPALVAVAHAAPPSAPSVDGALPCAAEYTVINLGPDAGLSLLNERGHAAFASYLPEGIANVFFDGRRLHELGSLGGTYTALSGMNNEGVVVGESDDASLPWSRLRAFRWTREGGMRALQGPAFPIARAFAVNDNGQVAGAVSTDSVTARANRWNPDGTLTRLGPLPLSLSEAHAINRQGMTAGFADVASGDIHAMVWDATGAPIDLGTLGGPRAFAEQINVRGEVAGVSDIGERQAAFYWRRERGVVPIGAQGHPVRLVAAMNDRGEVTGNTEVAAGAAPYLWSLRRGRSLLPLAGAAQGDVFDLNNRAQMVGSIERAPGSWRGWRAAYWSGLAQPVDLNTRLHRAPGGLVLYAASAINDQGTILAHSNAGLVMLRPGRNGTPAPVLGPITGPSAEDTVPLGQLVDLSVRFVDSTITESHTATASVDDGCAQPVASVREARGSGEVSVRHRFCQPGYFAVKVEVRDRAGNATQVRRDVWVTEPSGAALMGQGSLGTGRATQGAPTPPLRFALWAPLGQAGAPKSSGALTPGRVSLSGPFHFHANGLEWAERDGHTVRLGGTGTFNGRPGYRFTVHASAGAGGQLQVRISHTDPRTNAVVVDYDNGAVDAARSIAARVRPSTPSPRVERGTLRIGE